MGESSSKRKQSPCRPQEHSVRQFPTEPAHRERFSPMSRINTNIASLTGLEELEQSQRPVEHLADAALDGASNQLRERQPVGFDRQRIAAVADHQHRAIHQEQQPGQRRDRHGRRGAGEINGLLKPGPRPGAGRPEQRGVVPVGNSGEPAANRCGLVRHQPDFLEHDLRR